MLVNVFGMEFFLAVLAGYFFLRAVSQMLIHLRNGELLLAKIALVLCNNDWFIFILVFPFGDLLVSNSVPLLLSLGYSILYQQSRFRSLVLHGAVNQVSVLLCEGQFFLAFRAVPFELTQFGIHQGFL